MLTLIDPAPLTFGGSPLGCFGCKQAARLYQLTGLIVLDGTTRRTTCLPGKIALCDVCAAPHLPAAAYDHEEHVKAHADFLKSGYRLVKYALNVCECGAAKTGIAPRASGHSSWCPVAG